MGILSQSVPLSAPNKHHLDVIGEFKPVVNLTGSIISTVMRRRFNINT